MANIAKLLCPIGLVFICTNLHSAPSEDTNEQKPPQNGYAEILRPKVKAKAKTKNAATLQNQPHQPYQPIKKQDDAEQIPEVDMFVGESRVFPAPGVGRIAVGNGQIMTAAALDNKEIILFANAAGTSSLFIWNEDGRYQRVKINIVPGDTTRFAREITSFLATIPNAKSSIISDKVIVEGDNLSDIDIAKIDELAKRYPQIVNFTNRLGWEQMILMDVKVVEFPINGLREMGLKWSATGGAAIGGIWSPIRRGNQDGLQVATATTPVTNADGSTTGIPLPSGLSVLSAINMGLNAQLNLLAQEGKASILAEPQLSARNGAKATFLAGGEYPYTVSTLNGPTVLFKPYGIKLDIVPKVDRNGVIRATIDSEVSSIDSSISTTAGPALSTRKTNTEFNVKSGETLVLAGLLSRKTSSNIDKLPFFSELPILGPLFRSQRFQNDETELVVFVTPTVVDSRSSGLNERVERATKRLQEDWGKQPYLNLPNKPAVPAPALPTTLPEAPASLPASTPITPAVIASSNPPSTPSNQAIVSKKAMRVQAAGLAIRAEPGLQSTVLTRLERGDIVYLTNIEAQKADAITWFHIAMGDGQGWIASQWLKPY